MGIELQKKWLDNQICIAYRSPRAYDAAKPTIVMLHSFLMDSNLYEPQFKDPTYEQYNLIAVDEHGHGGTLGRQDFSFWSTAEDTIKLMDILGVPSFFVLGTSQGGFVAMRMALLAPARVQGLILLGTNAGAENAQNKELFKTGRDNWCKTAVPTDKALENKGISFGGRAKVSQEQWQSITAMWKGRHAGPKGYDPAVNCLSNRDSLLDKLHDIKAPVLVMHGTNDTIYSVESAKAWSVKLRHLWRFIVVDGGYHYLSFVQPGSEACRLHIPEFIATSLDASARL